MSNVFIGRRLVDFVQTCESKGAFPSKYRLSVWPNVVRDLQTEYKDQLRISQPHKSSGRYAGQFMGYDMHVHFDKKAPAMMMLPLHEGDGQIMFEGQVDLRDAVRNALKKAGQPIPEAR